MSSLTDGRSSRGNVQGDDTARRMLQEIEGVSLSPNMTRRFDEKHVVHVRDKVMPQAIADNDVEVVRACEDVLSAHGHAYPNRCSGLWEPLQVPRSELQVREMFGARMPEFGYRIVRSGDVFPDWLLLNDSGEFVYTEVEHRSSAFMLHGHDPSLCDLVVCWEHDDATVPLPVLELFTGSLFEAAQATESANKSELQVNWAGIRGSRTHPVKQRRVRAKHTVGDKRVRAVYERFLQVRASIAKPGDAARVVAEEEDISPSTVRRYVSLCKNSVKAG